MSSLVNASGLGSATRTLSTNLAGHWVTGDIIDSLPDRSGNGRDLTRQGGAISTVNSIAPGRIKWDGTSNTPFILNDTSDLELIGASISFMLSFRVNLNILGETSYLISKIDNSRDDGFGILIGASDFYVRAISGASQAVLASAATIGTDATDHHVVYFLDRTSGLEGFYLDGVDDTVGSPRSISAYTASDSDGDFMLGAGGTSGGYSGSHMGFLTDGSDVQLWDVQLYKSISGLPTNYPDLIAWLLNHPYQALSAEQW